MILYSEGVAALEWKRQLWQRGENNVKQIIT